MLCDSTNATRPGFTASEKVVGQTIENIFRQCVVQYCCSQNLVIIKTLPGLASAACSAIDQMALSTVLGSIAGDDTAFIAMRDSASASAFCEEIRQHLN